jgi:hypothetical protein
LRGWVLTAETVMLLAYRWGVWERCVLRIVANDG